MKIGLINLEPKIVNTALMQISTAEKKVGNTVEWAIPLEYDKYDRLYCSSLFSFTPKNTVPDRAICGGTRFNLETELPDDHDQMQYDYSIYPDCDYSIVWYSRGCVRKCPFCVVPAKEGMIKAVIPKCLNPKGKRIVVQDNNFFAAPQWRNAIEHVQRYGLPIDFQGVDIRAMTVEKLKALAAVKLDKSQAIKIAWDDPHDDIATRLSVMLEYIPASKIECYVLIGYWSTPEEDLHRVRTLWDKYRVRPFVMPYNKKDVYQKAFANWVNRHYYKIVPWKEFRYNPSKSAKSAVKNCS